MTPQTDAQLAASTAVLLAGEEFRLGLLGDHLAKERIHGLTGIDAVRYYIIQKHNWLPRDVRSMSTEDMLLVCAEELQSVVSEKDYQGFRRCMNDAYDAIRAQA